MPTALIRRTTTMPRSRLSRAALLAVSIMLLANTASHGGDLTPTQPRCEYRVDPLGIDVTSPRLSWIVASEGRGQVQTAYRVLVARDAATLARDQRRPVGHRQGHERRDDLDRLRRPAARVPPAVPLEGQGLGPGRQTFPLERRRPSGRWACSSPRTGRPTGSATTPPAARSRCPRPPSTAPPGSGTPATRGTNKPQGHRLFVTNLALPGRRGRSRRPICCVTADDSYRFTINGTLVAASGTDGWNAPESVDVTAHLKPGPDNTVRVEAENGAPARPVCWRSWSSA